MISMMFELIFEGWYFSWFDWLRMRSFLTL